MIGSRTADLTGAETITVTSTGHKKSQFTLVLSCLANGIKLKPMIIFKRKNAESKISGAAVVLAHIQENGWINENGIKLWLRQVWDNRLGNFKNRSLLTWNMF